MEITGLNISSLGIFVFWTIYVLIAFIFAIILPGYIVSKKHTLSFGIIEKLVASTSIGMILWLIQGLVFGLLHARWLSYFYLLCFILIAFRNREDIFQLLQQLKKIRYNKLTILIFGLGIIGQTLQCVASGFIFPKGWYSFISDDSVWHLGLTGSLVRNFPPMQPGMFGEPLTSYHIFANFFIAEFIRVFHMPLMSTQFLYMYTVFSIMLGSTIYFVLKQIGLSKQSALLGVYLQYFSSDIIYLTSFIATGVMVFNIHPLEDGTMFLENPPRAFAMILTAMGLLFFLYWRKQKKFIWALFTILAFGFVIGGKANNGLMVLMGSAGLFGIAVLRRNWSVAILAAFICSFTYLIYVLMFEKAGSPVFAPFEMGKMFVVQPNLGLNFLELRRQFYEAHGNIRGVYHTGITMIILFLISQFGIRNFAWLGIKRLGTIAGYEIASIIGFGLLGTTILASFFIQPIGFADIFNSYIAASVFLTIGTAVFLDRFIQNTKLYPFLLILVLFTTMPRFIDKMFNYDGLFNKFKTAQPFISRNEIEAGKYLQKHTESNDVIAVINNNSVDSMWSYVSALSKRNTYLSGQKILNTFRIDYSNRSRVLNTLDQATNSAAIADIINNEPIDYIYYTGDRPIAGMYGSSSIYLAYKSDSVTIYGIKR